MPQKIIARGAEAVIFKIGNKIIKDRIPKGYRHPDLDNKLRSRRTRAEAKLIKKAKEIIPVPKLILVNELTNEIDMTFINGKKLSDHLDKLKPAEITRTCKLIGSNIALLHDAGLIHGDLTTSNMILSKSRTLSDNSKNQKVFFIDFGLGFHSDRIEDKAVDLHLIKQALEARHSKIYKKSFKSVLSGYKKSKNYKKTLIRLEKVEKRGRYKQQY